MCLAEDQYTVQELAAESADEAFADRVHPRRLDRSAHDPRAGGLEDGVERGGEVRSAVAYQEPDVLEPLIQGEGKVAGLLHRPVTGGMCGDPAEVHPAGAVLDEHQDVQAPSSTVSTCRKSTARIPRPGHARIPPGRARVAWRRIDAAACRISHTVDGATARPSFVSSPWIRWYPHSGFSLASRTTRRAILAAVGGSPGLRRLLVPYFSCRSASGARPAESPARGRPWSSSCGGRAGRARRTTPGRPVRLAPGQRGGAAPRSRAGAPALSSLCRVAADTSAATSRTRHVSR